ncbi:hypothetical protein GCM10007874_08880 [Labrys miyagiensis]|uniref:Transglycosylase SLT domain-containing protein n=1 Tax=Labrys miyagiensis TaxID=346912 RepID=A0ABQ6CDY5_9HYPH|nr:transglycosylase SLT domain-containing protein [Labrys miyagiensis]GLS17872.1 hypothetical protein GCM10007874_08880 [Labrys miyagiensis]
MKAPLKRLLVGCVALGLMAAPGLASADDTVPVPPAKAAAKPKAKPLLRAKATATKAAKPAGAGTLLLPQPEPMDAGLAATPTAAKSAAGKPFAAKPPATKPSATTMPVAADASPASSGSSVAATPLPPSRPLELVKLDRAGQMSPTEDDLQTASIPVSGPLGVRVSAETLTRQGPGTGDPVDALISKHAQRYGLPESLLRRVVKRESGGNPHLRHGPYLGLMQMRLDTARGMGYNGGAEGLLDADTSLTYGAAYLANAWRVSGGNPDRAVSLYSGGYYYEAKRKGMLPRLIKGVPAK